MADLCCSLGVGGLAFKDFPDQKLSLRRREPVGDQGVVDAQAINRSRIASLFGFNTDLPKHDLRMKLGQVDANRQI
jgi:hypothetical protein